MIAISTTYMILHKLKYQPIGRRAKKANPTGGGANNPNSSASDVYGAAKVGFDANLKAATEYTDVTTRLNLGLAEQDVFQRKLIASTVDVVKQITILEEREAKLTSAFKTGTRELALRSAAFNTIQEGLGATSDEMAQYRLTMEKTFGLSGKIFAKAAANGNQWAKGQITAFNYLSKNTNLSADQQASLQLYAAGAGRSLEEQIVATKAMAESMGDLITESTSFEEIMQGISSLSSDIRSQYNKIPASLEKAVLKSKQLGVSMEQLHQSGKSLLDIESSVGKEIEYQLLSGQRLVKNGKSLTNAYREATLAGDMEQQADIMKDVLETQSATLDGNNMLAKQALADSMGLQLKDLMYMNEKKHLQEQITESMGDAYDLNTIMERPDAKKKFELELIDKSKSTDPQIKAAAEKTLAALEKLTKSDDNRRSPAENTNKILTSMQDQGLNVRVLGRDNKGNPLKPTQANLASGSAKLQTAASASSNFANVMMKPFDFTKDDIYIKFIGGLNESSIKTKILTDNFSTLGENLPLLSDVIVKGIGTVEKLLDKITGGNENAIENKVTQTSPDVGGAPPITVPDAVIGVNDGIIKFNDKDKLTVVASPFGTMNEKVADKITNPAGGGSSMDMNTIVAAIQKALGNINITVALDPMAIDKEIKFRQGSLNS